MYPHTCSLITRILNRVYLLSVEDWLVNRDHLVSGLSRTRTCNSGRGPELYQLSYQPICPATRTGLRKERESRGVIHPAQLRGSSTGGSYVE